MDKMILMAKNSSEEDKWKIQTYSKDAFKFKALQFALTHADDNEVFILKKENMTRIAYFKNNKAMSIREHNGALQEVTINYYLNPFHYTSTDTLENK